MNNVANDQFVISVTILLNDSKNGDFKKQADFNVDSLDAIITLITSKEMFIVDREDSITDMSNTRV